MPVQIVKLLDPIQMSINGTFTPKGAYNAATDYSVGDQVDYNGSSYIMYNNAAAGTVPTNTSYWGLVASKGDTGAAGADSTVPGPAGADGLTVSVNSVTQVAGNITIDPDDLDDTSTTHKFVTATDITKLSNLSGTNTGDQDLSTYQLKPSEGAFVNGDKTKLDGIETGADVTDATNVASAGAVMDGDFSANGVMTRTAAGTYTSRTITGTTNQITVTNGDGVSGNPTLSLPSAITTPGTLTTTGVLSPSADSTHTLGTSSLYWSNTYTDRLYLNSTAYLDGGTAGQMEVRANILKVYGTGASTLTNSSNGFVTDGSGLAVVQANGFALGENISNWKPDFSLGILSARKGITTAPVGGIAYGANIYVYANYDDAADSIISIEGKAEAWSASGGTKTIGTIIGVQGNVNGASTGYGSATNVIALSANIRNTYANAVHTYGLKISDNSLGTNRYGAYVGAVSGGTLNYAIYTNAGLVHFGDTVDLASGKNITLLAGNITTDTTTGTKIGTSTTQKLGFFNATPVVQPSSTPANATDLATAITLVNDLKSKLVTLGLIA